MLASLETSYLDTINALIDQRLKPIVDGDDFTNVGDRDLNLASRHLCISDYGKRARPLLCLYFHWLLREELTHNFASVGVAAEFIHAASLLHDDIIDEADRRRGKSSANRLFGNAKAVLAGDFLLTEAFELLREFDRDLIDSAIVVVREMTKAAMVELNTRGRTDVSIDCLRGISKGKTGALFAWCGFAAGHCCKDPKAAQHLWGVGERIGLIFQLADDIKDFDGDKSLKDVCRDIRNRELSLPILFACSDNESVRREFADAFLAGEISEDAAIRLKGMVMDAHGVEKARTMMFQEVEWVLNSLAVFSGSLGKSSLERFIVALCSSGN